jgi:predicted SprT family Zn-dependent metalloprotease
VTERSSGRRQGSLRDDHPLSERARTYGEAVVRSDGWSLSALGCSDIAWATTTRTRRRNGRCAYEPDGECVITIAEHVYEQGGFAACEEIVRHELVHAWQHQHRGERAIVTDAGARLVDGIDAGPETVRVEPGHGPSFQAWVDPLDLSGRCSTPYERERVDYNYVVECPDCGEWWGKFRLCKTVRQAAHGRVGPTGYRYCTDCETLLHLRVDGRYLDHGLHDDKAIRAFADGDIGAVPTTNVSRIEPAGR